MDTSSLLDSIFAAGGYLAATVTIVVTVVKGRREAAQIGAETSAIEQKTGPEVDSIYLGNAGAALEMQLKVNESQATEIERLRGVIQQKDEQIMLLETNLRATRERLDAAEFSLRSARKSLDQLEIEYTRYRQEFSTETDPEDGPQP